MSEKMKKGFTIIELIVVIAIITILATIVTQFLETPRTRSHNARVIADIDQITKALQLYATDKGVYPGGDEEGSGSGSFAELVSNGYLTGVPKHPDASQTYKYQGLVSPSGGACPEAGNCAFYHVGGKVINTSVAALGRDADKNLTDSPIDGLSTLSNCAEDGVATADTDLCYDLTP